MEFLGRLRQQLRQIWAGMSPSGRVGLGLLAVVSLGLVVGVAVWSSHTEYRILYANLTAEDAGAVTTALQNQGVPYRLESGGTTVLVPADRVAQANITLAAEGVPARGGRGFELFDQSTLGTTPFTQHVNYQRALQAELARTIMQIDPVVFARVHIVRPDPSPFVREQKAPTASVMLRLKPGAALTRSAAAGIAALVSRSVEGLTTDNVTIMDARGRVLSEPGGTDAGIASSQLDYRRNLETYLSSRAEEMLGRLLGSGRAVIKVAADINFQRLKERKESYSPDGKVVTEEKTVTSNSTTGSPAARGPAGPASNLPGRPGAPAAAGGGGGKTQEETTEVRFAVSKVIQEFEDKFGSVNRLTVAAMLDLSPRQGTPSLSLADAGELIKQAVGFKAARDEIKVSEVRLTDTTPAADPEEAETWQRWQFITQVVRSGSLGLTALVVLLLGWLVLRRLRPAGAADEERARRVDRLARAAREDPQAIAQALATWMGRSRAGGG